MKEIASTFRLLSDESRLRILMLLANRELCVCQIMGVLGISQPLVSKNVGMLEQAGFLKERKEGKLVFYELRSDLSVVNRKIIELLRVELKSDKLLLDDLANLRECEEFQKKIGKCDMKTFSDFLRKRRKNK